MIQIDEPPNKPFCAQCAEPLLWAWLPTKQAWVALVRCSCGERWSLKPHGCRHAQDPRVWREIPRGDPPSADYLAAKKALKSATTEESDHEHD